MPRRKIRITRDRLNLGGHAGIEARRGRIVAREPLAETNRVCQADVTGGDPAQRVGECDGPDLLGEVRGHAALVPSSHAAS